MTQSTPPVGRGYPEGPRHAQPELTPPWDRASYTKHCHPLPQACPTLGQLKARGAPLGLCHQ